VGNIALGNFFVIVVLVFYVKYVFSLFDKGKRVDVKQTNEELDVLRKIPVKTVEEQRRFMDLRYPKKPPFKFKWSMIYDSIPLLIVMFFVYYGFNKLFNFFNVVISVPMAFLIIIVGSLIINFLLSVFGLEKQSALVNMFRRGGK